MKKMLLLLAALGLVFSWTVVMAEEEDPFGEVGPNSLGTPDGSSSLRMKKIEAESPTAVLVKIEEVKGKAAFPACEFTGRVLELARDKTAAPLSKMKKNGLYQFKPVVKMTADGKADLADAGTVGNLSACFLQKSDKVVVDVSGSEGKSALAKSVQRK